MTIEIKTGKTYTCNSCDWQITMEYRRGTVTNDTLFALHRKAHNYGDGYFCNTCKAEVASS